MADNLQAIENEIDACDKCLSLLKPGMHNPRPGFPSTGSYDVVVIGAEPGWNATDRPDPVEYKGRFSPSDPGAHTRNTIQQLFCCLEDAGLDFDRVFFTNSVKCAAERRKSPLCFRNCRPFLERQVRVIGPKLVVIIGRAASNMGMPQVTTESIERDTYLGYLALRIRHPRGASRMYRQRVASTVAAIVG